MLFSRDVRIQVDFAHCGEIADLATDEDVAFFLFVRVNRLDFAGLRLHEILV